MILPKITRQFITECKYQANLGLYEYLLSRYEDKSVNKTLSCLKRKNQPLTLKELEACLKGRHFKELLSINKLFVQAPDQVFDMDINLVSVPFSSVNGFVGILKCLEAQNKLHSLLGFSEVNTQNLHRFFKMTATRLQDLKIYKDKEKMATLVKTLESGKKIWLTWTWMRILSLCYNFHFQLFTLGTEESNKGVFIPHLAEDASAIYLSKNIDAYIRLGHIASFTGKSIRHLFLPINIPQFND